MLKNKNKIIILTISFLTSILSLISYKSNGQSYYDTPYNRFGIGDIVYHKNSQNFSTGGIFSSVRGSMIVNYENPASYSAFDSMSFVFNIGSIINNANIENLDKKYTSNSISLSQVLMGFPVTRWLSASFGFVPYSNVNYNNSEKENVTSIGEIKRRYWGSGGINTFYGGFSIAPIKFISIGTNLSLMYGYISQYRTVVFPESQNYFNILSKNSYIIQDFMLHYGIQCYIPINKKNIIVIGSTLTNKTYIKTTREMRNFRYIGEYNFKDSLHYLSEKGNIVLPLSYSGGISFSNQEKFTAGIEFFKEKWSEFKIFDKSDSLTDSYQIAAGIKFIPDILSAKGYYKKIQYRIGFRYAQTNLKILQTNLNEFGISFGMWLPLRRLATIINTGFEYGKRGKNENGLLNENFFRIYIGLNIYERWFFKRKYQ